VPKSQPTGCIAPKCNDKRHSAAPLHALRNFLIVYLIDTPTARVDVAVAIAVVVVVAADVSAAVSA